MVGGWFFRKGRGPARQEKCRGLGRGREGWTEGWRGEKEGGKEGFAQRGWRGGARVPGDGVIRSENASRAIVIAIAIAIAIRDTTTVAECFFCLVFGTG